MTSGIGVQLLCMSASPPPALAGTLTQSIATRASSCLLTDTIADLGVSVDKGRRKDDRALHRSPKFSPTGYFQEHEAPACALVQKYHEPQLRAIERCDKTQAGAESGLVFVCVAADEVVLHLARKCAETAFYADER
jgi:hypothetical protein